LTVSFSFIKEQIIIINYLLILILAYHTIAYFTRAITKKNEELEAENLEMNLALHNYLQRIPSVLNKTTSLIPVDEILYFRIEDGILFAYLSANKKNH
jgi:DNA-binding LytR/AlgR family response regulator